MQNWSTFLATNALICSSVDVLYLTWPTFVCTFSPVQILIPSQEAMKICFQSFENNWLNNHHQCLQIKLLLTTLTSTSPQVFANRLLEQMLANFTLTQCVNLRLQDSAHSMGAMQIYKNSSPVRTNLEASKIWSCCIFSEWDRNAELRIFTKQEFRKSLIASIHMVFVDFATQCLKQCVFSNFTVVVNRHNLLQMKK